MLKKVQKLDDEILNLQNQIDAKRREKVEITRESAQVAISDFLKSYGKVIVPKTVDCGGDSESVFGVEFTAALSYDKGYKVSKKIVDHIELIRGGVDLDGAVVDTDSFYNDDNDDEVLRVYFKKPDDFLAFSEKHGLKIDPQKIDEECEELRAKIYALSHISSQIGAMQ